MPTVKITPSTVLNLKAKPEKRSIIWDGVLTRFGIQVEPSGHHKWIVRFGTSQMTIGKVASMSVSDARTRAGEIQKHNGLPPPNDADIRVDPTVEEMFETTRLFHHRRAGMWRAKGYIRRGDGIQNRADENKAMAVRHVYPHILPGTRILDVTDDQVVAMHDNLKLTGLRRVPDAAVREFKAAFNRAVKEFKLNRNGRVKIENPARGIKLRKRRVAKSLTEAQYRAFGLALKQEFEDAGADGIFGVTAIFAIAFMGDRKNEILRARRDQVEPYNYEYLRLDDHKTIEHVGERLVPIPAPVGKALRRLPVKRGWEAWFFPGRKFDQPLVNIRKRFVSIKNRANAILEADQQPLIATGPHAFTIRDLRKAFATFAVRKAGGTWEEIQGLLGHTDLATTRMYVADDDQFTKQASDQISQRLEQTVGRLDLDASKVQMTSKARRRLKFRD